MREKLLELKRKLELVLAYSGILTSEQAVAQREAKDHLAKVNNMMEVLGYDNGIKGRSNERNKKV